MVYELKDIAEVLPKRESDLAFVALLQSAHLRPVEDLAHVLQNREAQLALEEVGAAECDDLLDAITPAREGGL